MIKRISCVGLAWMGLAASAAAQMTIVEYIHTDALGSPVATTNAAGVVIERQVYEPYGAPIAHGATDGPGFTGHVGDAVTGLTYMEQRYYDQELATFLSSDPVRADGSTAGVFNRYWYANANPYKNVDPDGRSCTGSHVKSVCDSGGVAQLKTSVAGDGAARQANKALRDSGAKKTYDSKAEMYKAWAEAVEPVAEAWGYEIGSLTYKAGGGQYSFGPAQSSGDKSTIGNLFSGSGYFGWIHTHPTKSDMGGDYLFSPRSRQLYCPSGGTCGADLRTAVNYNLDAVVVHGGQIFQFTQDSLNKAAAPVGGYVKLGDLVEEVK